MKKPLVQFETAIKSIDPSCLVDALVSTDDYYEGSMTPHEAAKRGIDMNQTPDFASDQDLGEELENIAIVQRYLDGKPDQITVSKEGVHIGAETIKINYGIQQILAETVTNETINIVHKEETESTLYQLEASWPFKYEAAVPHQNIRISANSDERCFESIFFDVSIGILRYCNSKGKLLDFCNFNIYPLRRELEINKYGKQVGLYYMLQMVFPGNNPICIRTSEEELQKISATIRKYVDSAVITTEVKASNQKLINYIRSLLPRMQEPDRHYFVDSGWQVIGGRYIYATDDCELHNNYLFKTNKRLVADSHLTKKDIGRYIQMMYCIGNTPEIGGFAVTYSFMGIIRFLFEKSGNPIKFALNIVGTTGSLKTELSKVLYLVFNRHEDIVLHTFTDTVTSQELYIASLKDEVGLIDDLELGDSPREALRQSEAYNDLIRKVGDGKGKNRSNCNLETITGDRSKGLLVVTGEQAIGKQSTRLRTAELNITHDAINGKTLAIFQKNVKIWPTVILHFIKYTESNFENIVNAIAYNYANNRALYNKGTSMKRQVDQIIAFTTVIEIIENFLIYYCCENQREINAVFSLIRSEIEKKYEGLGVEAESVNPGIRFLIDIDVMINTGKITVSGSKEEYLSMQDASLGYEENGMLLLRSQEAYAEVSKYEKALNRYFPFDMKTCFKAMWEQTAIERYSNGNAYTYTTKISQNRRRQIAIKINKTVMENIVAKYAQV